jgi:3-phosphoshikimate 1-carboxyvinyltransferase
MLRPENRVLIDILRQNGAAMEIVDNSDGSVDLALKGSGRMKPTRVADKRAENLLDHVALVAILATQTEGQFIIRDVESLRQGDFDFIEHLAEQLRAIQAKVGEYPYGLVIDGGRPLKRARITTNGHAGMAQAFAVAGLLANGGMEIDNTECVEPEFPGFFDKLTALQSSKTKEKTK